MGEQLLMANNGTLLRGTPVYAAGKFGNAVSGAVYGLGTADTAFSSTGANGGNLQTGTVEGWFRKTTVTNEMIVSHVGWYFISASDRLNIYAGGGNQVAFTASPVVNDNAWHHFALVFDAGVTSLYLDGARTNTSSTVAPVAAGQPLALGGHGSTTGYDWSGSIDEVRFSNTARYSGTTYTVPAATFTSDAATTALYHLESDATDSATGGGTGGDTTAPTVPTALTVGTVTSSAVPLSWTASTDAVGVTGYKVRRGGTLVGSPTGTSYTDTSVAAGTIYSYTVSAVDAAGNESAQTASVNATTPAASANITVAPNASGLGYSPYNWDVTATRAATINPGAYFRTTLAGATSITLNFDMSGLAAPYPRIKTRLDNGPWATYDLAATVALTMPTDNTWTTHVLDVVVASTSEFVNRWNPQQAIVKFTGITTSGTVTIRPNVPLAKNVLIYGDSITEGYKTAKDVQTPDGSDATVTWSYLQRGLLGAEVGVVGFGAQGWVNGGQGGVPQLPTSYNQMWSGVSRSFTAPVPDLIVMNMGQNDSADTTSIITSFLNTLLALNTTTKVVVMRPFSGAQTAFLQAAIAACSAPSRVTYVDTTGWWNTADTFDGVHPTGNASQSSLAPRLANTLLPLLSGTTGASTYRRFINKGGTAVGIG
jgi:hypothetical protein